MANRLARPMNGSPVLLRRGKGPVATVGGAGAVRGDDSEMISSVRG